MTFILRLVLRVAVSLLPAAVWARYLAWRTVRKPSSVPLRAAEPLRILALSNRGFRGDLEALADSGEAEVYLFPYWWQTGLVLAFYGSRFRNRDVMNPARGSRFEKAKQELSEFYERVLQSYFRLRPCDSVVSFHIRTPADIDFGRAAMALNVPYCTIFREGLLASSDRVERHMRLFFERLGRFQGDHFLVHSASARDFCVAEGYSRDDQTWAMGCMRMDGFLREIESGAFCQARRDGIATLFPPAQYIASPEEKEAYQQELYCSLIGFFARNPNYRLIIKPKPKLLDYERDLVEKALAGSGLDLAKLGNVEFNAQLDAHEAIRTSDVILGLNSTTLLEAGVAGKPVIAPFFTVLDQESARESLRFSDAYQYFDVAKDGQTLARLLSLRMENPLVDDGLMQGRRAMFEKYVTALDGDAVRRYVDFFRELSRERRQTVGKPV